MVDRATKLRWRRRFRRSRKQVESMGEQAEQQLEEHVIGRLGRLWNVRRFLLGWTLLITLLITSLIAQTRALSTYYQTQQPVPGGTYTEGILGAFTTANPLYATGQVDSSVARLVFSGLFKYDDKNNLTGDLADTWTVNERGNVYTVTLKPGVIWHDGEPLTSADVLFTYQTIQNPDADSPLFSSWQGVKVAAPDERTITFTLPQALSSFPYAMTNGIVPRHILSSVPVSQLRSISFDTTNPVGSGAFRWSAIEVTAADPEKREERIALVPNEYYTGGAPKLDSFIIRAFHNEESIIESFNRQELDGVVGFNKVPDQIAQNTNSRRYSFPLTSQTMVFFKTSAGVLAEAPVRKALVQAADTQGIVSSLGYAAGTVNQPLLRFQAGYDKSLSQAAYNPLAANQALDAAGWVRGPDGFRSKGGVPLAFRLVTESTPEYAFVTEKLQEQWKAVGVKVDVALEDASDLQTAIAFHNYDALLYGISIGVDPDVLAYWHSSQADIRSANRLNFSEYKSKVADSALEAGRTRSDPTQKAVKYRPFVEAWRNDAPALGLYQPRFLYIARQSVAGLVEHTINAPTDRYSNVQNWMIRETSQDIVQ
ncbi:MAG: bac 5 protein [Patescibacteria group bacterium]|nr:bac 5 protein [Patescibacteria group bacterium]